MSAVITLATLRGACRNQRELFAELFPKGSPKTRKAALAAARKHADKFDWEWAAAKLLRAPAQAEYEKVRAAAQAEYEKVSAPAWAECDKVCAAAWAECDKVRAAALAEYDKVCAAAQAEYEKVSAPAWAEYEKVRAATFVNAWFDQQEAKI